MSKSTISTFQLFAFSSLEQTAKTELPSHVRDAGDYTTWVYPDDGLVNFYAQSFPSCNDAMIAASEIINRNGAKQINIVHSPSGSVLHTWERGSWRTGR